MRKGILLIGSMAAIAFAAGAVWALPAPTKTPTATPGIPFPLKGAKVYKTDFAHAMDPCTTAEVLLARTPGSGIVTLHANAKGHHAIGCEASFAGESPLRFGTAELSLSKSTGSWTLTGSGFAPGAQVGLEMVLRSSREDVSASQIYVAPPPTPTPPPASHAWNVTYLPVQVMCPAAAADAKGKIVLKGRLDQCVGNPDTVNPVTLSVKPWNADLKVQVLNMEVLDATLLDISGGKCSGGDRDGLTCTTQVKTDPAGCPDTNPGNCVGTGSPPAFQCDPANPSGPNTCTADSGCSATGAHCAGVCNGGARDTEKCRKGQAVDCPPDEAGTCVWKVFGRAGLVR